MEAHGDHTAVGSGKQNYTEGACCSGGGVGCPLIARLVQFPDSRVHVSKSPSAQVQ